MPTKKKTAELYNLSTDRAEASNLSGQHPERVQTLTRKLNRIIARGRSTPGSPQANDTPHWKELTWMKPAEYKQLQKQGK